ncbi:retrovirus-related Pol polyprotein from transposon TNT 1-94 [Trichonephila clavipes]|nr:retrovirus-related Pol polyprotein from transposon TNT 1-94 [Trichonephila clavipes]
MANNQSVRRHLDAFTRGRITGKLEEGRSATSVAAEFGIAHSIVSRLWRASFHSIVSRLCLAKSKRVSFKKTGVVRSKRPLELLHMDLCGPMPTESQGGNKYFLSIIDDYSRKVTVFPIRNKSDVFHTFIRFQKRAERFLSKKVIAVRTDMAD